MFELDKESFGSFVAEQRRAKGYTQRELAERLFVSDKAVSKWERGLSMPDISLLIPLAEILGVSVTELLEGRRMAQMEELKQGEVERLVKKALLFSEETPEKKRERRKKHAAVFGGCCLVAVLEVLVVCLLERLGVGSRGMDSFYGDLPFLWGTSFLVFELLSLIFGVYFWLFMKEWLPVYYDEYKISAYSDGMFRMNLPGVSFNNSNWPHIVKALRLWSVITLLLLPPLCFVLSILPLEAWAVIVLQNVLLIGYLLGLFAPIYVVGKKYGMSDGKTEENDLEGSRFTEEKRQTETLAETWAGIPAEKQEGEGWTKKTRTEERRTERDWMEKETEERRTEEKRKNGKKIWLVWGMVLFFLVAGLYALISVTGSWSGVRIGFVASGGLQEWTASYSLLDGQLRKELYPSAAEGEDGVPYVIAVKTKQGTISITLTDREGNVIFSAEELEPGEYPVMLRGKTTVKLQAKKHKGSFSIREKE